MSRALACVIAFVLALLIPSAPAHAAEAQPYRLAVVELRNGAKLSEDEVAYLTDQARTQASKVLPGERFLIMTRESIVALLPPGKTLADCAKGQCEVEVGRTIGADYIVTGEVLRFGEELRLNLKVHACKSGAFLGSESAKGTKVNDLESGVTSVGVALFGLVMADAGLAPRSRSQRESDPDPVPRVQEVHVAPKAFELSSDGLIVTRGEMMWTRSDNGKDVNISQATAYCEACRLGGYSDWRLPTIDELEGLHDPSQTREVRVSLGFGGDRVASMFLRNNSKSFPVHMAQPFQPSSVYAVSSTTGASTETMFYDFFDGKRRSRPGNERTAWRAFCVRSIRPR
jgi:TolB-like protein